MTRRPASPRALLIDALGTLVTLRAPAPALVGELARSCGLEISEAEAQHALAAEIAFYRAHMHLARDADSLAALRLRCGQVLRAALPGADVRWRSPGEEEVTAALLAALRFDPCEDARPALLAARESGRRIVAVSNWDVSLSDVLELAGLAPLLDAVVTSAAVGAAKPDPAIFRHALALAGAVPERAMHVGDSLAEDVEGARACGIEAVLLVRDRPPGVPPGVRVITSLAQLFDAA